MAYTVRYSEKAIIRRSPLAKANLSPKKRTAIKYNRIKTQYIVIRGSAGMPENKDCILTYTKIKVDPLNIQPKNINIVDIAHSLSMMARANGHFKHFYSVAQHSINCAIEAKTRGLSKRIQLACLLHDAAEAYIADVPRPVKNKLIGYDKIEKKISDVVYSKFDLKEFADKEHKEIKEIDDALLYYEFRDLMETRIFEYKPYISTNYDFSFKSIDRVKSDFLSLFNNLLEKESPKSLNRNNKVVGVDGCRAGWLAFTIDNSGYSLNIYNSIEMLCRENAEAKLIIIDMPLGLPESINDIRPEIEARKILGKKASSIFNCPCRQAVYKDSYKEANEMNKNVLGKGLSQQSYAICPKIREIDMFLKDNEEYKDKLIESHPEICFSKLNGTPIFENKKTPEGIKKRISVLSKYYKGIEAIVYGSEISKKDAQIDDILDAICLAVVAKIGQKDKLKAIPSIPQKDNCGLLMQMVYSEGSESN